VYRQLGETQKAVEDLCDYLETFYTDLEGWLELTDLYENVNARAQALQALSHAMVISPQNPFYVLQFAELAADNEEIVLALKMHLRAIEMVEGDEEEGFRHDADEVAHRAWLGVQMCTRRLLEGRSGVTQTGAAADAGMKVPSRDQLEALEELAKERLRSGVTGGEEELQGARDDDVA